ncbi:rapid alkalinization factor-like [Phragmites australis]|uniref:rapid alkalinization factor-like n=1 Tax=Phragmites australis TaxID=29695 RepID=UPI002D77A4EF|nr:rapid alkalinization factor-like [Phragmites australis]
MASPRHSFLVLAAAAAALVVSATAAELATVHGRVAAEWARSVAADEGSCWGSPEELPVVYGVGGGAAKGLRRLQYYYDVNTAASLLPTPYISYSALMRDSVPCSVPGASYYNCQPGADANPYTRGCSAITQCRD